MHVISCNGHCSCHDIRDDTEKKFAFELLFDIDRQVAAACAKHKLDLRKYLDARVLIVHDTRDDTSKKVLDALKNHALETFKSGRWGYVDATMTEAVRSNVLNDLKNQVVLATDGELVGTTRFGIVVVVGHDRAYDEDMDSFEKYCDDSDNGILLEYRSPWFELKTTRDFKEQKWHEFTKFLPEDCENYIGFIALEAPELRFIHKSDLSAGKFKDIVLIDLKRKRRDCNPEAIRKIQAVVEDCEAAHGVKFKSFVGCVYIDKRGFTTVESFDDPNVCEFLPDWCIDEVNEAVKEYKQANDKGWVYHSNGSHEA